METRKLGKSGLAVPAVGMGTFQTFDVSGSLAERHCFKIVDTALEVGTRLFDSNQPAGIYPQTDRVPGEFGPNHYHGS